MSAHDHERWSDDLSAYLLGALDPGEATELERHLDDCESCRQEMRWLEPAVRSLPEAVERRLPPPQLRDRLMSEVRDDARAERRTAASAAGRPERAAAWFRGHGRVGLRPVAGLAAVALLIVAFAGYEIGSNGPSEEAPTSTIVAGHPPGVTATMVRQGDGGTLRLANVHRLPEDRVLEAWVRREGQVEAVPALFVPDRAGRASTTIADMSGVDTVMVTAEPPGGSTSPTSAPIVTLSVPQ